MRVSVAPWWRACASRPSGEVDGDDPLRAGEAAADHGAEADEAAAEDDARRARLDARRVEGSADPRREPAREWRATVERRLGADLRERDLGHHRVLGEGRGAHEVAQRLAVAREPRRAVGQVAEPLLVADREAAVGAVAEAVDARPALRREQRDHVVARGDERDALADPLDDTRALVAEHAGRVAGRVGAGSGVEVGVADAAGGEPDEHLAGLRLGEIDLLDDERAAELLEHRCANLHGASLSRAAKGEASASLLGAPRHVADTGGEAKGSRSEQPLVQRERLRRCDVPAEARRSRARGRPGPSPRRGPGRRAAR